MPTLTRARQFTLATTLLAAVALSGCNIVSGNKTVSVQGRRITSASLAQVQPNQTSADWLDAAFGAPTSRKTFERDGVKGEIWRYEYRRSESSSGEFLFLYDGWNHKEETTTTCFELIDGKVRRYWTEKSP
ncbi:MAG: hypothetical protein IT430_03250 [Phycisphaerales bacterium]|nr:hypothetical protein [Phycisphaerales bacterium]